MAILACTGTPVFDYTAVQGWPIGGDVVASAIFNFNNSTLLVLAPDHSYVIVQNVPSFNALQANQQTVVALIATNPTTCSGTAP